MSALSGAGGLTGGGLPPVDQARLPASIRDGSVSAKRAYQTALGFEQVLVGQLAKSMVSTASTPADGSSGSDPSSGGDGGSGTDGSASGLLGSDPASSTYAQFLPDVLTSAIMSGGGTGMALQLAKALDPSIGAKR